MDKDSSPKMPVWASKMTEFEGDAFDLADALIRTMSAFAWAREDPEPNVRLIRHYTQLGALDRPERRGKQAFYGFRQFAQYVALRWLVNDGWPLQKAALETSTLETERLVAMTPTDGAAANGGALSLVRKLRTESGVDREPPDGADSVASRQLSISARRSMGERAARSLGAHGDAPSPRGAVRIDLAPWCTVVIDRSELESMSIDGVDAIAAALRSALLDARLGAGRKKP